MMEDFSDDVRFLKGRLSFPVYYSSAEMIDTLTDEEAGLIFKALIRYAADQKEPAFKGNRLLCTVFSAFRKLEDYSRAKYLDTCKKNSANGKRRKLKRIENEQTEDGVNPNSGEEDRFIETTGLPFR